MAKEKFGTEKRADGAKWQIENFGPSDFSTEAIGTKKSWKHVAEADAIYGEKPDPKNPKGLEEGPDLMDCCD